MFNQGGDHVFALVPDAAGGAALRRRRAGLLQPRPVRGRVRVTALAAGQYLLIVKATSPQQTGLVSLRLSASDQRPHDVEICNNGIDDDGNGLIDCVDPDCFGVGNCTATACTPDQNAGSFAPGRRRRRWGRCRR